MRLTKRFLIALLLLGVLFGGVFGYKFLIQIPQQMAGFGGPQPANVVEATVQREDWQQQRESVGSLTAVDTVAVSTEVAGIIESIAFESGAAVEAGDTLLTLDQTVDQAELDGLRAEAELARIEFRRAQDLLEQRAISQSQFDEARVRLDSAVAAVRSQRARIGQKTITAPFDGVLGLRRVSPGQYLAPGSDIVTLRRIDPIYADFTLPERFLPDISNGQRVEVRTSAYASVFTGTVTAVEPDVSDQTRSVSVRATLENADGRLRPGMFARIRLLQADQRSVLTIPRTAVNYNTYGDFAMRIVEGDDGLVSERVQIETGAVRDGRVEVVSGLAEGDRVVGAGLVKVRPGQPVTIDDSETPDPAAVSGR
ncbi:efflux RND transporter periplasmic adaptor subunit [Spiribacter pallidus]|uniref:efflux RND transporter periplasmic adaptor subunit n=1 Tax=Spiribacter pallidus TaxID=1987936 RepID=UPI00349F72FA